MKDIHDYLGTKHTLQSEERLVAFRKLAQTFGTVDAETKAFREQCQQSGFRVVFRSGLSREETLDILKSPETTQILASY